MKYKIGTCQFQPQLFDINYNRQKMYDLVRNVQADLIVFPELATSGYVFSNKEELQKVAEEVTKSETIELFKQLSKQNDCSYIFGFPEKNGEFIFNSSVLINPDGKVHVYRKIHLFFEEKLWFSPGNLGFEVVEAKGGVKVGMMICFDWIFPESARTLALNGCDIIAHPANLVLPWCQQAMLTRSLENRVISITANRIGKEINGDRSLFFTGESQVVSFDGQILFRLKKHEEKVMITTIESDFFNKKKINNFNHIFEDRQTQFYKMS